MENSFKIQTKEVNNPQVPENVFVIYGRTPNRIKIIVPKTLLIQSSAIIRRELCNGSSIELPDEISEGGAQAFIQVLFTKKLDQKLHWKCVFEVLHIGEIYEIPELTALCVETIREKLSVESCFSIYNFVRHNAGETASIISSLCIDFICKNIMLFLPPCNFANWTTEFWCAILSRDDLVCDEKTLFGKLIEWGEADKENSPQLKKICRYIRFNQIRTDDIFEITNPYEIMDSEELDDLMAYNANFPSPRFPTFELRPRTCNSNYKFAQNSEELRTLLKEAIEGDFIKLSTTEYVGPFYIEKSKIYIEGKGSDLTILTAYNGESPLKISSNCNYIILVGFQLKQSQSIGVRRKLDFGDTPAIEFSSQNNNCLFQNVVFSKIALKIAGVYNRMSHLTFNCVNSYAQMKPAISLTGTCNTCENVNIQGQWNGVSLVGNQNCIKNFKCNGLVGMFKIYGKENIVKNLYIENSKKGIVIQSNLNKIQCICCRNVDDIALQVQGDCMKLSNIHVEKAILGLCIQGNENEAVKIHCKNISKQGVLIEGNHNKISEYTPQETAINYETKGFNNVINLN